MTTKEHFEAFLATMDEDIEKCPCCGGEVETEEDNFHPEGESLWCPSCFWEENTSMIPC